MRPPQILGTQPVGGNGPGSYTFEWQKSYEPTFASPVILINDADPRNYTPTLADAVTPSGTVWFRRIVTSSGPLPSIDVSKPVEMIVHKKIVNNNIGSPDTICYNANPPAIQQLMPDLIVPTVYNISWQDSSISGTWGLTIGAGKDYDPQSLTATTRYRRIVTSGSCADTSRSVEMTVLESISNNSIISADQSICFGFTFDSLKATTAATTLVLGGGDNAYRFKWESNINAAGWITAQGISNAADYKPLPEVVEKAPSNDYDYRRIVFSGTNDACADTSARVHLRDYHTISGNTIGPDNQLFCSGSVPIKLTGLQPNYGDGNFTYTWQSKTISQTKWNDITGSVKITDPDYQPPQLYDTTSFRRIAYATCVDSTNFIRINIHPAITSNSISLRSAGADTTICNGQTPAGFIGTSPAGAIGSFTYQWLSMGESSSIYIPITNAITSDFPNPVSLVETTLYRRQVSSGACVDTSNAKITVTVLLPISNNTISSGQAAVCENTAPEPITGSAPAGGGPGYMYLWEQSSDGSAWSQASGANTSASYQPPVLTQVRWYRRNVISGLADCCTSLSNELLIGINPAPLGPVYAGPDESIFSTGRTYHLKADPPVVPGESGFWTSPEPGTASIVNISDSKTEVKHMSVNKNIFVWTITNELCNIEDSVTINLKPDFIPEGFSPNYDNVNDIFVIEGLNLTEQTVDLTIINGAGTVVFSASNRNGQQWEDFAGKNKSGVELPEGTYYYMLYYSGVDQPTARKSGFIVLKRH
jgi:gliding motility-associated-like protein